MKETHIEGLPSCPICKSEDVKVLINARNAFQIRCGRCGKRTKWEKKTEAVISWFNLYLTEKQ